MEDPAKELVGVVMLVTAAANPEVQRAAVLKYYAPDIRFRHPLCAVRPAENSRDAMLSILSWYRILSPVLSVHVNNVMYDPSIHAAFLDVSQTFHIRWSPLRPAPTRLFVRLKLRPVPAPDDAGKAVYVIEEHEDFYHPDELAALVVPPLMPLIWMALAVSTLACRVLSRVFNALGYWAVRDGEGGKGVELQAIGKPLPLVGNKQGTLLRADGQDRSAKPISDLPQTTTQGVKESIHLKSFIVT